jgi:hypothetical protein
MKDNNQIIIGKTKEGELELTIARFGWRRLSRGVKSFEPTMQARQMLNKYQTWTNFSLGLKNDPRIQSEMQKILERYI